MLQYAIVMPEPLTIPNEQLPGVDQTHTQPHSTWHLRMILTQIYRIAHLCAMHLQNACLIAIASQRPIIDHVPQIILILHWSAAARATQATGGNVGSTAPSGDTLTVEGVATRKGLAFFTTFRASVNCVLANCTDQRVGIGNSGSSSNLILLHGL